MSDLSSSIGALIAPFLFAVGKTLRSDRVIESTGRLDPMFSRAVIHSIRQKGWDSQAVWRFARAPQFIAAMNSDCTQFVNENFSFSRSQLFQDLFVLLATQQKREGYFVEVGVGDGMHLSNTHLLEKHYGWKGILAEPNPAFHESIIATRTAILDPRAVYSHSHQQLEMLVDSRCPELSTLASFANQDRHDRRGQMVSVQTITLNDLLVEHDAPNTIDYISIDTEGSEFEVLGGLDLTKRKVLIFSIESNGNTKKLRDIKQLLDRHGYVPVLENISSFDTWFVHRNLVSAFISV